MSMHPGYYADLVQRSLGKSNLATEEIERDLHRSVSPDISLSVPYFRDYKALLYGRKVLKINKEKALHRAHWHIRRAKIKK